MTGGTDLLVRINVIYAILCGNARCIIVLRFVSRQHMTPLADSATRVNITAQISMYVVSGKQH